MAITSALQIYLATLGGGGVSIEVGEDFDPSRDGLDAPTGTIARSTWGFSMWFKQSNSGIYGWTPLRMAAQREVGAYDPRNPPGRSGSVGEIVRLADTGVAFQKYGTGDTHWVVLNDPQQPQYDLLSPKAFLKTLPSDFDPSVTGYVGPVGSRVITANLEHQWIKTSTEDNGWTPIPVCSLILPAAYDPTSGAGKVAPMGTIANNGTSTFIKAGAADTDWVNTVNLLPG
jgi:hypothetical protein